MYKKNFKSISVAAAVYYRIKMQFQKSPLKAMSFTQAYRVSVVWHSIHLLLRVGTQRLFGDTQSRSESAYTLKLY